MPDNPEIGSNLTADYTLDGGDDGCGELLLAIKLKLRRVPSGGILQVITTDPGAPEDLPAWCRLTGNSLLSSQKLGERRVAYFIKKEQED